MPEIYLDGEKDGVRLVRRALETWLWNTEDLRS